MKLNLLLLVALFTSSACGTIFFNRFDLESKIAEMKYKRFGKNDADPVISFCIRRLNLTHQTGCGNSHLGQIGVPAFVTLQELDGIISCKEENKPKILIVQFDDKKYIKRLKRHRESLKNKISGVIFFKKTNSKVRRDSRKSYSHDSICPNTNYGMRNMAVCEKHWLADGVYEDYALIDWPFPIFLIHNKEVLDNLTACEKTNLGNELVECAVMLKSAMHGKYNSKRCLKRSNPYSLRSSGTCHSILARNVFSPLMPIKNNQTIGNRSVVLLTARLDSFTMFASSPGANTVYSSLIVLLTVARMLNERRHEIRSKQNSSSSKIRNVLFALFDGEAFGYVGSSSWLFYTNYIDSYYTASYLDNFTLSTISHVIELNQLMLAGQRKEYTVFAPESDEEEAMKLVEKANQSSLRFTYKNHLPPNTINVFKNYDSAIKTLLIAGFGDRFDSTYHSLHDTPSSIDYSALETLSEFIAKYLFWLLTGQERRFNSAKQLVPNLGECFFESKCEVFNWSFDVKDSLFNYSTATRAEEDFVMKGSFRMLINSARVRGLKAAREIISQLLSLANPIGPCPKERTHRNEQHINKYDNRTKKDVCIAIQTVADVIRSPFRDYLDLPDVSEFAGEVREALHKYPHLDISTWTESEYFDHNEPSIWIFHQTPGVGYLALISGMIITSVAIGIAYLTRQYFDHLFTFEREASVKFSLRRSSGLDSEQSMSSSQRVSESSQSINDASVDSTDQSEKKPNNRIINDQRE